MTTLAIGDIHGTYTPFKKIIDDHAHKDLDIVLTGDYIDRQPEENGDINTVDLVRGLVENPEHFGYKSCVALTGNHERLMLESIIDNDYDCWISNGGNPQSLHDLTPHLEWLAALPTHHVKGDYLFVHAGVKPHVPLEGQKEDDLIWIRKEYLKTKPHGLPYTIVSGHTITQSLEVEFYDDRIYLDTGSFFTGNIGHTLIEC